MTKWVKANNRTAKTVWWFQKITSLYCNSAFKTRKRQHSCHVTILLFPKSKKVSSLISRYRYNIDILPSATTNTKIKSTHPCHASPEVFAPLLPTPTSRWTHYWLLKEGNWTRGQEVWVVGSPAASSPTACEVQAWRPPAGWLDYHWC